MNNQWLKDIEVRLSHYEEPEPEGLWDDIETILNKENARTIRRKRIRLWSRRISAIAAATTLLLWIGYKLLPSSNPDKTMKAQTSITAPVNKNQLEETKKLYAVRIQPSQTPSIKDLRIKISAETTTSTSDTVTPDVSAKEENKSQPVVQKKFFPQDDGEAERKPYTTASALPKEETANGNLSFNLFASNLPGTENSYQGYGGFYSDEGLGVEAPGKGIPNNEALSGILRYNLDKSKATNMKHDHPIRFGLSARYRFNNRWSLESGAVYSILNAHLTSGSESYHYKTQQTLHYIGIPMNVSYSLWNNRHFDLYLSGGGMMEKNVSGHVKTEYILNGEIESSHNDKISIDPLQWSVNGSLGLQYNITPQTGFYIEPGVSHYFDNGSSVENIYNKKPTNFNLNLGLRYTIR